jgi:hypothetical protein
MKKIKYILVGLMFCSIAFFTSCLKAGLEDLPSFTDAEITNIYFEYRYQDPNDKWTDGSAKVKYVTLTVTKTIDNQANTVTATINVPSAGGSFTETERAKVALTNIVCTMNISTAASVKPADGAPTLGVPGDFSSPKKYIVTAADGTTNKTWTVTVTALNKP